ncbi:hypothetical protein C1H46_018832 [Malus baccata]|uniref:Uncharacterized protein n=1 Tax=Malus baccata TaxID=106549 RepID=A0A540MAN4_MALBA|nr:hypothetical protein C1H46_018832 [Malus baccata]
MRRYSTVDKELDGLTGTLSMENAVEASGFSCCPCQYPVEIVCRVRVLSTPPLSLCCLPILEVSLMGFHELHNGSKLGWRWRLMRRYSTVDKELDGLTGTLSMENAVEASGFSCCVLFLGLTVYGLFLCF